MKRLLAFVCGIALLMAAQAAASPPCWGDAPAAVAAPTVVPPGSVFALRVYRASSPAGTAFCVNREGKPGVMTAWHVVDVPDEPYKVEGGGKSLTLVFKRLGATDVAFCPTATPPEWRVSKMGKAPALKENAVLWGLPGAGGLVSSKGPVSARAVGPDFHIAARGAWVTVNAPVWSGMSGGPVLNPDGAVFGVISASREFSTGQIVGVVAEIP